MTCSTWTWTRTWCSAPAMATRSVSTRDLLSGSSSTAGRAQACHSPPTRSLHGTAGSICHGARLRTCAVLERASCKRWRPLLDAQPCSTVEWKYGACAFSDSCLRQLASRSNMQVLATHCLQPRKRRLCFDCEWAECDAQYRQRPAVGGAKRSHHLGWKQRPCAGHRGGSI